MKARRLYLSIICLALFAVFDGCIDPDDDNETENPGTDPPSDPTDPAIVTIWNYNIYTYPSTNSGQDALGRSYLERLRSYQSDEPWQLKDLMEKLTDSMIHVGDGSPLMDPNGNGYTWLKDRLRIATAGNNDDAPPEFLVNDLTWNESRLPLALQLEFKRCMSDDYNLDTLVWDSVLMDHYITWLDFSGWAFSIGMDDGTTSVDTRDVCVLIVRTLDESGVVLLGMAAPRARVVILRSNLASILNLQDDEYIETPAINEYSEAQNCEWFIWAHTICHEVTHVLSNTFDANNRNVYREYFDGVEGIGEPPEEELTDAQYLEAMVHHGFYARLPTNHSHYWNYWGCPGQWKCGMCTNYIYTVPVSDPFCQTLYGSEQRYYARRVCEVCWIRMVSGSYFQ